MIRFEKINGLRMACWISWDRRQTDAETIVFIHGSGGNHTVWLHQCAELKESFNIAALDLPGHGLSEGRGEQDVTAYAVWVQKILEALSIEKPVLVGHSLGAAISLRCALMYGEQLDGIVPVGGGATMPVNPAILEGIRNDPSAVIALAAKIALAKSNRDRLSKVLMESMAAVNPEVLYGDFLACDRHDVKAMVSDIRVPTLVICGDEDRMTPPEMSLYLRERIPGAQGALISKAGHFVMLENIEEFNKSLSGFVESYCP